MSESRLRGGEAMKQLSQRLVEIRGTQKRFTVQVLFVNAVIYAALLALTRSFDAANKLYTNSFQYQAVAWCCWFMLPYFLRVEAKQDAGMAMAHDSVDILEKVDIAIDSRLERFDRILQRFDDASRGEGVIASLKSEFKEEMRLLREEVRGRVEVPNPALLPDPLLDGPPNGSGSNAHVCIEKAP